MRRTNGTEMGTLAHARGMAGSIARDPLQSAGVLAALAGVAATHPLAGLAAALAGAAFVAVRPRRPRLDLMGRTPEEVERIDRGFTLPLGRECKSGRPIVLSEDEARQHLLVLGTPGPAKTDFLLGMSEAALSQGAGLLFVDGRGQASLFAKAWRMAERLGRLDDLIVLNMMEGEAAAAPQGGSVPSNTFNPFAAGSAPFIENLLVSLLDGRDVDLSAWKMRGAKLMAGVVPALVHLRDRGRLELDAASVGAHLTLQAILALRAAPDMPEDIRASIDAYLATLPGFNAERGPRQAQTTQDQHGFVAMQFADVLRSLGSRYGHVLMTSPADVDLADVMLNRRILVVMLPPVRDGEEAAGEAGRIVLAALKGLMGQALRSKWPGNPDAGLEPLLGRRADPFLCVMDDVSHYAVEGLALLAAQARALGFSMTYSARDIPTMKRLNEREATSIIANTNTKVFLAAGDPEDAGSPFTPGMAEPFYLRRDEAWLAPSGNVDRLDLKSLRAGEMLVLFKAERLFGRSVTPGSSAHAEAPRPNRFVRMSHPRA